MGAFYDPRTRKVNIVLTRYEEAHERAHAEQHANNTRLWRFYEWSQSIPVLCRVSAFLLEFDAAARALSELPEDEGTEAVGAGLMTYALAITMLPALLGWAAAIAARSKRKAIQ